jgi:hypothetical protein
MADDDIEALSSCSGWTVEGPVATFCPAPGNWCARVRKTAMPDKAHQRYAIAIANPNGTAAYAEFARTTRPGG